MEVKCKVRLVVISGAGRDNAAFAGVIGQALSSSLELTLQQLQRWGQATVGVIHGSGAEDFEGVILEWNVTTRKVTDETVRDLQD